MHLHAGGHCNTLELLAAASLFVAMSCATIAAILLVAQIDPDHASKIVLFHEVEPEYEHLGLKNQDTGDKAGDAYFLLRGLQLPVECGSKDPVSHFDCDNPEQGGASSNNVVSMHSLSLRVVGSFT